MSPKKPRSANDRERDEMIEYAWTMLQEASFKRTKARAALIDALVDGEDPLTTEELFQKVKGHKIDLVTVYRTLGSFEQLGLVRRSDFGDGFARYEFQSESGHHHHHVVCKVCRKSQNIDRCMVEKFEKLVGKMGYSNVSHTLEFFGVCKSCRS